MLHTPITLHVLVHDSNSTDRFSCTYAMPGALIHGTSVRPLAEAL